MKGVVNITIRGQKRSISISNTSLKIEKRLSIYS